MEIKYRRMWALSLQLTTLIARVGFYLWVQVQNIALDWILVTLLVRRALEVGDTYIHDTFYFRHAELTITLHDVALL